MGMYQPSHLRNFFVPLSFLHTSNIHFPISFDLYYRH
jgi:hypothetical protein